MISRRWTVWLVAASCAVGILAACGDDKAKSPAAIGDLWVIEQNSPDYTVTVIDTAAVVSVPAGVFWTWHYRMTNETGGLTRDIYYAPGLGRVYEVTASAQPNPHTHVTELTDFSSPNC